MKNFKLVLITVLFGVIIFSSCSIKEPVACFTMDKTTAKVGETVTFTDCSTDVTRRILKTGDLASGIPIAVDFESGTAQHVYNIAGTYTVNLDALNCKKDNKCKSDKTSQIITITP
ncbi:MAG: hypothetical protein QQN41_06365 [Nitrosopumilus sp.]